MGDTVGVAVGGQWVSQSAWQWAGQ
ncbi:hypothetical protein NGA_0483000 [Nannochloropsis gaditana CCMP526]|nr:hypothetical protein NGA_0483000 [Nannochloropsis gaditana CCMP526]EKU22766.1 hypothetical protein NGA_0483000 [Nannochloropsis gaditana CCMP526]|eukprot:XP_005853596.1 hypothetical protein NGA_0483000 [Nannochloropsis gaditana CCMP526]